MVADLACSVIGVHSATLLGRDPLKAGRGC